MPAESKITIENVLDKECLIVADGQGEYPMDGLTKVEFRMSDSCARFIKFKTDFFSRVREKLVNNL